MLAGSVSDTRSVTAVLGAFAGVAILLAALGLYGVLAFFVSTRVREIGIRMAVGAPRSSLAGWVVSRGMILVLVGSVVGLAGTLGVAGLLESMLFDVTPRDPATYLGVTGFLLLVALGASSLPAWRALQVDPVEALRRE